MADPSTSSDAVPAFAEAPTAARRRKRTRPHPGEIALMRRCLAGPRHLTEGPVGRCTKHGWLEVVVEATDGKPRTAVRYALTDKGRDEVDMAEAGA